MKNINRKDKDLRVKIKLQNNLIISRAESLWGKGITQKFLADVVGIHPIRINEMINFRYVPIHYRTGEWKDDAIMVANVLECDPWEIFPEWSHEKRKNTYEIELCSTQLREYLYKEEYGENIFINKIFLELSTREEEILRKRFGFEGEPQSLDELASAFDVSRERIKQIEKKALGKIRTKIESYKSAI